MDNKFFNLDNASTTAPYPEVVRAIDIALTDDYLNMGAKYKQARVIAQKTEAIKKGMLNLIGATTGDVIITPSATAANNLAFTAFNISTKKTALVGSGEHSSVHEVAKHLIDAGAKVEFIKLTPSGTIDLDDFKRKMTDGVSFVSVMLVSNETGAIMENFMLSVKSKNGSMPKNPVVVKTIVTSDMATDIAKKYGAEVKEVLTGFKYIGETIDSLENPEDYVFGMEESYGYLVGRHVRDKDSVSAAMIIVDAAAYYASTGKTLIDALEDLYAEFGYYKTALVSRVYPGEKGKTEMDALISALRENPLKEIAGIKINEFKDYSKGIEGLPKSNVLSFIGDGIKVIVRPSGTEPKVKYYLTAKRPTEKESDEVVELLKKHI